MTTPAALVQLWREANGVLADGDFAFFFDSFGEAEAEVGSEVAQAWQACRRRIQHGLGASVKDLMEKEAKPVSLAPAQAKSLPVIKPTSSVAKPAVPRFKAALQPVEALKEPFLDVLKAAARQVTSLKPGQGETLDDVVQAMLPKLQQLVEVTEVATLKRAQATWVELEQWAANQGWNPRFLSASQFANYYQACASPSRVLNALRWLGKHLHTSWDLTLCVGRVAVAKGRHGVGAKQAPTAEPTMFRSLQRSIEASLATDGQVLPALICLWLVVMGCVRLAHVQRSEWVKISTHSLYFVCKKGKQRAQRQGFMWSCPRYMPHTDTDLGLWFLHQWTAHERGPPEAIGFDFVSRQKLAQKAILDAGRMAVRGVVPDAELAALTGKSWRQLPITWGTLCELTPAQMVALGNWTDHQKDTQVSAMPLRYTGSKQHLALLLKHTFGFFLAGIWTDERTLLTWSDLDRPFCITARDTAFQQASDVISSEDEWTSRNPEQGVNLIQRHFTIRGRKMKRPICQLVSSASPVSEVPAKRLAPARSSGERPGVNLPVAAERAAPPVNLEAELLMGDPNDYFDELAKKRWNRKGDSYDPEPPTVVYRKPAQGCIILGGLPTAADRPFLQLHDVKLIVSCFQDYCTTRGGVIPSGAFQVKFNLTAPTQRDKHWDALKLIIKPTLAQGHGIYIHCSAGCHRAPVATAIVLACLQGKSFDDAIAHLQKLRNIEPWKIVGPKCSREFIDWVHTKANSQTLAESVLRVPAEFISAAADDSLWHMVPYGMSPDKPHPVCKWRQVDAQFKRGVIFAKSANEAIVRERPFCNACYNFMPAHVLGELSESRVKWRSR